VGASANNANCAVILGASATTATGADDSVVIGTSALSCSIRNVVLGYETCSLGAYSVAIGYQVKNCSAVDGGNSGIMIGNNVTGTSYNPLSIGFSACSRDNGVAIGLSPVACQNSVAIGNTALAQANETIAIGASPYTVSPCSIVIGNGAATTCNGVQGGAIAIGQLACAGSGKGIAIGACAVACGEEEGVGRTSISIGWNARSLRTNGFATTIGHTSLNCGYGVVIGYGACSTAEEGMAVGAFVTVCGEGAVHVGHSGTTTPNYATTLGFGNCNQGLNATILGRSLCASGGATGSVVAGYLSCSTGGDAIVLGGCSCATAPNAGVLGAQSVACHSGAIVIGSGMTSERMDTVHVKSIVALGQGASKFHNVGVVTGSATIDWNDGNNQGIGVTGNTSLTLNNPISGANYTLKVKQEGSGSNCITWPAIEWVGATGPTLSTSTGQVDLIALMYDGTNYYGTYAYNFG
jgi:hypothetical protein